MHIVRLVYSSKASDRITLDMTRKILESAQPSNEAQGITGILFYNQNYFLQCIEGASTRVNKLYQKIVKDDRHTDIQLVNFESITTRMFGSWSMGFATGKSLNREIYLKYFRDDEFNPYDLNSNNSVQFLEELLEVIDTPGSQIRSVKKSA